MVLVSPSKEIVVRRLVGDAADQRVANPLPQRGLSSPEALGLPNLLQDVCANPPTPECMPYSPGSVWPGYSVSHIPSSPRRTWVNTHAQARSASSRYVDGSDDTSPIVAHVGP